MKCRVRLAAAVIVCAFAVFGRPEVNAEKPAGKVLVLGFQSDFLDEIQDRYFREYLIRQFQENGFPVVTVMELESVLQTEHPPDIRNVSAQLAAAMCTELGAGFVVCGKINRVKKKGKQKTDEYDYVCEAALFSARSQTFSRTMVRGPMAQDMEQFLNGLASELASRLGKQVAPDK